MPEITDPSVLAALNGGSSPAVAPAARPSIYRLPADPMAVRRDERADDANDRAAAAAVRAAAADARNANNQAAQLELERLRFQAQQEKDAREAAGAPTGAQRQENRDRLSRLNQLIQQVNRTQELFNSGPGSTSGLSGLRDYLPTDANTQFDTAGASLSQQGLAAFRVPGTGTVSDRDAAMFDRANLPQASNRDVANQEILRGLRSRVDEELRTVGAPAANWQFLPEDQGRSVWNQTYTTPQGPAPIAPAGSTTQSAPIDPRMQAELDAYLQQNGRGTTEAGLRDFIGGLYARYGAQPGPGLDDYAKRTANALRNGGQINTNIPAQTVPLSIRNRLRNNLANNPVGAGFVGAADAGSIGLLSLLAGDDVQALGQERPISTGVGQIAGAIGGTGLLSSAARNTAGRAIPALLGERGALARSLGTDTAYSALYGTAQGQDPRAAAALGLGGSVVGRGVGNVVGAGIGAYRTPSTLNAGQRAILGAIPDQEAVNAGLRQAQDLGLPMSLADISPEVSSLTGAAIRRNPTVAGQARDALQRRNLGQIDRFRSAVSDTLGPLDNVPQRADDIVARARRQAGPLYDQAYATPVPSSPELDSLLNTPFGRQAIGRSRTIAANERRSPTELGFAEDASGNVVLNPTPNDAVARHLMARDALDEAQAAYRSGRGQAGYDNAAGLERISSARQGLRDAESALNAAPTPGARASVPTYTTQSLDYAKRGMDDILEESRDAITGRLQLGPLGNSQNEVRQGLLREIDRSNPAYGQARAAYAGPAGEREALYLGRQALTEQPDLLAIQVGRQTPERLDMMRLGARDRLVQGASELSNSTNPYRAINTPAMEQRLSTLYGDEATGRLMAQRDAELRMANTSNSLIGNSLTAERQAADRAFADEGLLRPVIEGGIETAVTGAPTITALRRLAGNKLGDIASLGFGKKAAAKAAQISDISLNMSPGDVLRQLTEARALDETYKAVRSATKKRSSGMFGRGFTPLLLPIGSDR